MDELRMDKFSLDAAELGALETALQLLVLEDLEKALAEDPDAAIELAAGLAQ